MNKTYTQSAEEVLNELGVTAEGLSTAQAKERLEKYGPNKLKDAEKPTLLKSVGFVFQLHYNCTLFYRELIYILC